MYSISKDLEPRRPDFFLCKPNKEIIGKITDEKITQEINLGSINELEIEMHFQLNIEGKQVENPNIKKVRERYLIKSVLGGQVEYYLITRIEKSSTSTRDSLRISAFSLAYELSDKRLRDYEGVSLNCSSVLGEALSETIWSVGYVEDKFDNTFRQFNVNEETVLSFVFEIASTFGGVVDFDTKSRLVNIYGKDNVGQNRGLRIEYGKYLKDINRVSDSDGMVTRLSAFGNDGLSISRVNPTGSNYIESFSYFIHPFERDSEGNVIKKSNYLSDDLCHALLDYDELVEEKRGVFSSLLDEKESLEDQLLDLENELFPLLIEYEIILDQLAVANSVEDEEEVERLLIEKEEKQEEIDEIEDQISGVIGDISIVDGDIDDLKIEISVENNFTSEQISERNQFIIHKSWTDNNYIDDQELYEAAIQEFEKIISPKINVSMNMVNFLEVVSESRNWGKLNIGDTVYVSHEKINTDIKAKITMIRFNYEQKDINVEISDAHDIENDEEEFINKLNSAYSTSTKVDMSSYKWDKNTSELGEINEIIEGQWDANERRIVAGVNESVEVGRRGIIIKNPDFPDDMLVANSGILGISNDGGLTFRNAITGTGIVGERIFGQLIAGVNLIIKNESGELVMDKDGVRITDAKFQVTSSDDLSRTTIEPDVGFRIQSREESSSEWEDRFYVDTDGQLILNTSQIDGIESNITALDDEISIQVKNLEDEISSQISVVDGRITLEVENLESEISSQVSIVDDRITLEVENLESEISSQVSIVDDRITLEVGNLESLVSSEVTILEDEISLQVSNLEDKISSEVSILENEISLQVENLEDLISSEVSILEDEIALRVTNEDFISQVEIFEEAIGIRVTNDEFDSAIEVLEGEINLKVSSEDYNGEEIISRISLAPEEATIEAERINFVGKVFGQDAVFTGDIETEKDIIVGSVINLNRREVGESNGVIFRDEFGGRTADFAQLSGAGRSVQIQNYDIEGAIVLSAREVYYSKPTNDFIRYSDGANRFETNGSETGFCGTGGMDNNTSSSVSGTGVKFRVVKNFTPSEINLSEQSSNSEPNVINITSEGFWLFVNGNNGSNFRFWRGFYTG